MICVSCVDFEYASLSTNRDEDPQPNQARYYSSVYDISYSLTITGVKRNFFVEKMGSQVFQRQ